MQVVFATAVQSPNLPKHLYIIDSNRSIKFVCTSPQSSQTSGQDVTCTHPAGSATWTEALAFCSVNSEDLQKHTLNQISNQSLAMSEIR
jgi:hypothetical protein